MNNIFPGFLIVFFILFFLASFWQVLKTRDDLFAVFYGFLFIYTIFTQIGYVFFPDVAINGRVYFGIDLFYSYWLFVFLSFVATVGLFLISNSARKRRAIAELSSGRFIKVPRMLFFLVVGVYQIVLLVLFSSNIEQIRYANIENIWIGYFINIQPVIILVVYMKLRRSSVHHLEKLISAVMLVAGLSLFFVISFRAGQRLLGLSLLVGIAAFELGPFLDALRKYRARLLMVAVITLIFLFLADRIVNLRNKYAGKMPIEAMSEILADEGNQMLFDPQQIVHGDYFAPSSLIFVSMAYNWVDPGEVFRSNVFNYLVFTKYPYLQNILSEVANPFAVYSRTESYGYYLLTEGFNFGGWFGILYNAVMVNLGLGLWRFFASSRDRRFNQYMTAVLCLLVVGLVRGPSVTFVRGIYLAILPAMVLVSMSLGYYPRWARNDSKGISPDRTEGMSLTNRSIKPFPAKEM